MTGGTGFVGGWLTRALLDRGANVVMLVRDRQPEPHPEGAIVVYGDVRDQALMKRVLNEYSINTVYHLAAQAIIQKANEYPAETYSTNVDGTIAILEAARVIRPETKVIIASSDKAYGDCVTLPYHEDTPLEGRNPYDCSKSCADLIAQSYLHTYGLNVAITRCGNIYGPGDLSWHRLIPNTIRRVLRGLTPVVYGAGSETRDYFYIHDVVSAYLTLAEKDATGPYNFSTGTEWSVKETIELICEVMGVPVSMVVKGQTKGEISYQCLDSTKARVNLGWKPAYTFEDGLRESIDWYREYLA